MVRSDDVFPAWDAIDEPEVSTLTVAEVVEVIVRHLHAAFPEPFWLVGETSGWESTVRKSPSGHWYFRLVDDQDRSDRRASLQVQMFQDAVRKLFGPRGRLRGRLQPADGVVLRLLVRAGFYAPKGEVGFRIQDVDPEYTLGTLDRERRELLLRLQAEGVDRWNKARPLPDVPLRIALVTSEGSAAYHDVVHTLTASGLGFQLLFCDARTQGAETSRSVCAALATLGALAPDVLLLVRGGGSQLDLSWFDKEDIARAVAGCPVPVLTGIGHEIDSSVADAMAHTSCKTPTAAAEFLVARGIEARRALADTERRTAEAASRRLHDAHVRLDEQERRLPAAVRGALVEAEAWVRGRRDRLGQRATEALVLADGALTGARVRLGQGRHVERLVELASALRGDASRVRRQVDVVFDRSGDALRGMAERLRLLDPRAVLQRGYAWLRRSDGSILKDVAAAAAGDSLTAVLRDGELDVVAARVRPAGAPGSV